MQQSNLESYFKTGTFKYRWKRARWKKKSAASCFKISFFRRIKISLGILNGPLVLLMLREDIMLAIPSLSVGWLNNEFMF